MENMKQIVQKIIAIYIIFAIIITQYAIAGITAISYAIDLVSTQDENVKFKAYFVENESESAYIERGIDNKDTKLHIDVSVKNQGYLTNGEISLENAGFKLSGNISDEHIREINNNVIYLNQINADETIHLQVGIKCLEENEIPLSSLKGETDVRLKGTYFKDTINKQIDAISKVSVNWRIPQNTKAEILSKILTNKTYVVNEQNKKVVQFLVSSKLTNNNYPTKNTKLQISVPEGATNIGVHKRTTKATNGEKEFSQSNYRVENNILEINVDNTEVEGKISWVKGVQDVFVITYEFDENKDLSNTNITVNGTITTFDKDMMAGTDIALNGEQSQIDLTKEKDGIISVVQEEKESYIYKGKIYSKENRDITSNTIVYVDYAGAAQEFTITENKPLFTYEEKDDEENTNTISKESNVEYKSIKVNKGQISAVLGQSWSLKIGETTITNETPSEENGDIVIELNPKTSTVSIKASKPVNNGAFLIESTKTLLVTEYTRDEIKKFTYLEDSSSVQYNFYKYSYSCMMNLKETESNAEFSCEQQALMGSNEEQQLKMKVVLDSNKENLDLYKNPEIKIKLPRQITDVKSTEFPQLMYENGLQLTEDNYRVTEENGQKVVNIALTGEQVHYLGEAIQGVVIPVNLSVKVDKNAENIEEEIVMTYTNENATKYTDQGTEKVKINILKNNQQEEQNNENNNNQDQNQNQNQGENQNQNQNNENNENNNEQTQGELRAELKAYVGGEAIRNGDEIKAGEVIEYELTLTNRSNENINDLGLDITIPSDASILDFNPDYPRQNPEQGGAYYADGEFLVKKQNNNLVVQGINIEAGKTYSYRYMAEINKDLNEQKNFETNVNIKKEENNILNLRTQNTIKPANLKVSIRPLFRKYGDELEAERSYEYQIEIENLTNIDQNNVKFKVLKNDVIKIINLNLIEEYKRKC